MSINPAIITMIFDRHEVQDGHRQDPELLGAAYALAFLDNSDGGAEERFYNADTLLPGDTPEERSYRMPTRAMLTEIYNDRILRRSNALDVEDFMAEVDAIDD
ncbi:hypothetical protein [Arthrobacter sp. SD76]|uniref:hypothetical protein n=1 Tax=Arthrobacter sp. SD76 TaxID=3415007 RepID=UPI003C7517EC